MHIGTGQKEIFSVTKRPESGEHRGDTVPAELGGGVCTWVTRTCVPSAAPQASARGRTELLVPATPEKAVTF